MSNATIQTSYSPTDEPDPRASTGEPSTGNAAGAVMRDVLKPLASLRLTVVLFALSIALVFFGTLAQVDSGIWTVVGKYFRWFYVWIPFQIFYPLRMQDQNKPFFIIPGAFPFPGGWTLGTLLLVNLLAAHAVRFKVFWTRSGILLLHAGLVVLMLGELETGLFAVEGNMTILEDGKSNYTEAQGTAELVVIDRSDPKTDDVVAVPQSLLRKGGTVSHPGLPFDIRVVEFMPNSSVLETIPPGHENPATAGTGKSVLAVRKPEVSGTDPNQKVDLASAYVTLTKKGASDSLGTYLMSTWLSALSDHPYQQVTVDGKAYDVTLRFKRTYKPYTLRLIHFTHEKFPGTEIPKDFRSTVELTDPTRDEKRTVDIFMNNPLRYQGETFYQSSFLPGDTGTVMVTVGMLVHFVLLLRGFLAKKAARPVLVKVPDLVRRRPVGAEWLVPGAVVAVATLFLAFTAMPPTDRPGQMKLEEFGKIPVVDRGREKPLDTYARNTLMFLNDRQTYKDEDDNTHSAVEWLLNVMTLRYAEKSPVLKDKFIRIDNDQVLSLLGLKPRSGLRYAVDEFKDKVAALVEQARRVKGLEESRRELFDVKVMELFNKLETLFALAQLDTPLMVPPLEAGEKDWTPLDVALEPDPPKDAGPPGATPQSSHAYSPAAHALESMLQAYARKDVPAFNNELTSYRQRIDKAMPREVNKAGFEVFFNHFAPFYQCSILYVFVFLLSCFALAAWRQPLNAAAFWLAFLTLWVHTFALVARMYLQGRPPVTNLYSSAVFIGWGCVILGLVLEYLFRLGVGNIVGAVTGSLSLLIAQNLAAGGDTLEMMQAVLDTNFWLATHVTCVTIGYTATFVAGFLGIYQLVVLVIGHLKGEPDRALLQMLGQMLYGILCFATLFSFTGTVLGGIWADQSWGRFWGWDPKENGALIIVIWNALILHARWGGLVKQRGMALLAVLGNVVTAWSWFGVNMLGVGLHSYGFMQGAMFWLLAFMASQLLLIAIGWIPGHLWRKLVAV